MSDSNQQETFTAFKNSFSYGSRSDLNFKFLKSLSDEEGALFFQQLLWKLGDFLDDGDGQKLVEHMSDWQAKGYEAPSSWSYEDVPFSRLSKPVSESKLALLTSTGHFVEGDDPNPFGVENMTQDEAIKNISRFLREPPTLSEIPIDVPPEKLAVRHGGFDIRGAQADRNTSLPIDRLRELDSEGVIGTVQPTAYSFVGATVQNRLMKDVGPKWVEMLQAQNIEAALLVPV